MGRAARNVDSTVILYADAETESIRRAVDETGRRREKQMAFNERHGIVPRNIEKEIKSLLPQELLEAYSLDGAERGDRRDGDAETPKLTVKELERAMWEAVERLDFERAATLRDLIAESRGEAPEGAGRKVDGKGSPHPPARGRRRRR